MIGLGEQCHDMRNSVKTGEQCQNRGQCQDVESSERTGGAVTGLGEQCHDVGSSAKTRGAAVSPKSAAGQIWPKCGYYAGIILP